jgi:hypothetical protein
MSDELLFDSERQERKAAKKQWLIPLLVLAGILLAVIIISLLLRSGKEPVQTAGEDTSYPFSWQVQADGTVLLDVPHAENPEHHWTVTGGEEFDAIQTEAKGEKSGQSRFLLTPRHAGRALLELTLRKDADPAAENARPEDIYRLTLFVEVTEEDGKLTAAVLNASGIQLQSEISATDVSGSGYRIYRDERGILIVAVKNEWPAYDWVYEVISGQESLNDLGLQYQGNEVQVLLRAGQTVGESELVLQSEAAGAELRFRFSAQEDGSLLVADHQAHISGQPTPAESDPGAATETGAQTEPGGETDPAAVVETGEGDDDFIDDSDIVAVETAIPRDPNAEPTEDTSPLEGKP